MIEKPYKKRKIVPAEHRFQTHIDKTIDGCWEWTGCLNNKGYGVMNTGDGSVIYVHRFSYLIHIGEISKGLFVCHKCDNAKCVNPDHLFLGTHTDNMQDKTIKGRSGLKLTGDAVKIIREARSLFSVAEIANYFRMSKAQIHNIVSFKSYKLFANG